MYQGLGHRMSVGHFILWGGQGGISEEVIWVMGQGVGYFKSKAGTEL